MEAIKISVDVNLRLSEEVKELIAVLLSNSTPKAETKAEGTPKAKSKAEEAPKAETKAEEAPKAETEEAPKAETEEAPKAETEEAPKAETKAEEAPEITITDVRKLMALKVSEHREAIKAKLEELGSPSVTKLDPSKYVVMAEFLNSLD